MGKTDKSCKWFVRVTAPWEHIAMKYTELRSKVDHKFSVIGYHIGKKSGNPHAHIVLEMKNEVQKQSIDARLQALFDTKGAQYSSKIWDGNHNAISYLHHDEGGKVEYNMELTEEQRAKILTVSSVYSDIVKTAKDKSSGKIVENLLEQISASSEKWSVRKIAYAIYSGVKNTIWHAPGHRMTNYVEEIIARQYEGDEGVGYLTDRFCAKFT